MGTERSVIIPATPGFYCLCANLSDTDEELRAAGEKRMPIIAWRLDTEEEDCWPVTPGEGGSTPVFDYILYPDGRVADASGSVVYASIDDCIADLLAKAPAHRAAVEAWTRERDARKAAKQAASTSTSTSEDLA